MLFLQMSSIPSPRQKDDVFTQCVHIPSFHPFRLALESSLFNISLKITCSRFRPFNTLFFHIVQCTEDQSDFKSYPT